jgi:DnaD/phage-associated family protein
MQFNVAAKGKLDLGKIKDIYPLEDMALNGVVDADMSVSGKMSNIDKGDYDKVKASGNVRLNGMTLAMKDMPNIDIKNSVLTFTPRYLQLSETTVNIGENDITLDSKFENYMGFALKGTTLKGSLNVKSNKLNLNDFMTTDSSAVATAETQAAAAPAVTGEPAEEDLALYVSIDDMDFDEVIDSKLVDRRLRELYDKFQITTGRTVSRQEISKIEDAIKVYGIEPEIFSFAIDYCADLEKYSVDYIFKVALRWTEEGCRTVEEAKRLLDKHSRRNDCYRQVFRALGFNRLPAPIDREIMDRWFDQMNCSLAEVLDACSAAAGLREPNLKYVNKVIENRRLEKGGVNTRLPKDGNQNSSAETAADEGSPVSRKVLADYYEFVRTEDEKAREARAAEVLRKVPEMKRIFEAESSVNSKMLSLRPGADNLDARQRLRAERIAIEESRKQLLAENGFPGDYLTRKFRCSICRDTGYTDEGMVCSCCRERAAEAYVWHTNKEKA